MNYISTKLYGPEEGLSIAYRQWRADRKSGKPAGAKYTKDEIPGCSAIHGYAMSFYFEFECKTLDARNWVVDFGAMRPLKDFLKETFDHTMLVALDDPHLEVYRNLYELGLCKLIEVDRTGCEGLAHFLYEYVNEIFLPDSYSDNSRDIHCRKVLVRETPSNSAYVEESLAEYQTRIFMKDYQPGE